MTTKEMNFTNMNIKDFIEYIITFDDVDDIFENCKTQSEKGFIFERLFDIVIKFGFCNVFTNSNFNHLSGNSNNAKLKILENLNQYLNEKVLSGNSGGCSDITLQNKDDNTYIFITSKYPKSNEDITKQKKVDYYDIQKIIAMIDDNKHIYKNYKIYLVVPNKKKVLDKVKTANNSSNYITKYMTEDNILDKDDLNKYFLAFKQDIIKNKNEDWQTIYLNSKENLILRFHQELITQKTSNLIEEGNKSFLWGCKCRSGKTYMIGGVIIKQLKVKNKLNVLIITPAPTETSPQFTNDLFNKFKDFDKFKIHHIEGSKSLDSIETSDNNIFVMSKQLLQKYINEKTIMKIKNLKLDIIGFDENHFSGTTDLSKDILTSYSSENTIKIYLTATYNKPLKEWNILPECQMFWDIEDEQICKSILVDENNLDRLKEKHGSEYIEKTIKYYTNLGLSINDIFKCYEKMPDLHLITNLFDQQRYEIIKEKLHKNNENKMGFCFDTLFGLNKAKTKFSFENEVKTILRYISGSQKETDGEKTIFPRINNICSEKETRLPFTQIWFLPSDNINEISECLKKLMFEDNILKKYDVLCINRKNKELAKDIKDEINKKELIAKSTGKLGLILLAGNMLTLGITLNLCDLVILMNNALSSDKVLQQMYRCMTEGENKKIGFVLDLNISRVLNTCVNYTVYKNEKSIDDKMKYLIKNHLINIDVDMMENKKINSDMIVKKLMDIWKEDPINSFRTLLRKLDNDYEEFDNSTQKLINKTFTKSLKDDKVNLELKLKDEDDEIQDLPTGKEKVKNDSDNEHSDNESSDEEEKKETQISFTKDVLPYVIPLTCILTIKNSNMDFVRMLNDIKENPKLLDTFDDQCLIWWNKKDLIDLIKDIVSKYFDKSSNTYNISVQFKMSLQSLIDNPKELLELINDCLKPKEVEKKENGEVFTPMILVNEMLDKLPKDIWKNKNFKWLDPATGMGNFPIAVYLRLMEGLKDEIKDVKTRKKHILENMLYMCELNKKNVLVCKQIFDINNELKLNLYEGDSLKLDTTKKWKINFFDIIMGNPPYQKNFENNNGRVGGSSLWSEFINYSMNILEENGYLLFITPCSWMTGGSNKQSGNILNGVMQKYTILHLNIEECAKHFNVASTFSYYLIKKIVEETNFECICNYKKKIYTSIISNSIFRKLSVIPKIFTNEMISIIYKIENANNDKFNFQRLYDLDIRQTKRYNKTGKYNVRHKVVDIRHTDWEQECMNKDKIVISMPGYIKTTYDKECGCSDATLFMYVNNKQHGEKLINLLNSDIYQIIINSYRELTGLNNHKNINRLSIVNIKDINFSDKEQNIINNLSSLKIKKLNVPKIIKDGIKQYYLVNDKLYKIKKDKLQGELFGTYIDGKIIEDINNNDIISKVSKKKTSKIENKITNKEIDEIEKNIDDKLTNFKVSKKKTSKIETKITYEDKEIEKIIDDELNDLKVSKKKTSKPNIIINDDSNETNEKKVIKKSRIKKSNNNEI